MMRLLFPIILIAVAGFIFFTFTDDLLTDIDKLNVEKREIIEGLENAKDLRKIQSDLLTIYNNFPQSNLDRLDKLLPDNIDNVRLIIDINTIASKSAMTLKNIALNVDEGEEEDALSGAGSRQKGSITLGFSVSGSYEALKLFLDDLASSLRIVDVTSLSFGSNEVNFYDYNIELTTYWLK